MKFDKDENGGFFTTRDIWNVSGHEPLIICINGKVAVSARRVWLLHCSFLAPSTPPVIAFDKESLCILCQHCATCERANYLTARQAVEVETSPVRTS